MTLNEWQGRLEKHFSALKEQRVRSGSHVFALEHSLDDQELNSLQQAIGEFSKHTTPSSKHWLVWVVYATEVGYAYSGDEYWQTFGDRTPGWNSHNQIVARDSIRDAFTRFKKEYLGVRPTGRWAEHFSIICWPITHAILPKDLQRQLAEILFDIRHEYDEELLGDPERLGECIDGASWKASSRFQQFAEQHLLVGQIASALLLSEEEREKGLILATTLNRIASDLDSGRRAREWLSDARKHAFTVRVGGFSRGTGGHRPPNSDTAVDTPRDQLVRLGIEPSLSLRRLGKSDWEVRLCLPSFAPLLLKFPKFRPFLTGERCHVAGAKDKRPIARERLLFGSQEVVLSSWPSNGEILLRFERSCPELDHLLHTECLIRPGPQWLFKVGDDGIATELKTGIIRPGTEYILLNTTKTHFGSLHAEQIAVACDHIEGVLVRMPDSVSYTLTRELERLELSVASSLTCWPIGVPPAKWDDEGSTEYLSTDSPCLAIEGDFQSDGIVLNLVGPNPATLQLARSSGSEPFLVELGRLASGTHVLNLIAVHNQHHITATLQIVVRQPSPPSTPTSVLTVLISPSTPTLEELWDGTATLEVYAPENTKISCDICFYRDTGCGEKVASQHLGPLLAPITGESFAAAFAPVRSAMHNAYDEAACCVLAFSAVQLGVQSVRCEREPRPCRWAVKYENQYYWLRLIQADHLASPTFLHANFTKPDSLEPLYASLFDPKYRVPDEGGLFYAMVDDFRCAVVIPPVIRSLQDLKLRTATINRKRTEQDVSQVLRSIELWSTARIVGDPFSASRKQEVCSLLEKWLERTICDDQWSDDHLNHTAQSSRRATWSIIEHRQPALAFALSRIARDLGSFPISHAAEVVARLISTHLRVPPFSLAKEHGMSSSQWLTEFGIRIFAEPERVRTWAGEEFTSGLHYLLGQRLLAHICRYVGFAQRMAVTSSEEYVPS